MEQVGPPAPPMEHYTDWLGLALRWLHIVAGAAWIGTSFYFNWLNNNVRPPEQAEPGVGGELWSIHGGHFYRVVKYTVAPAKLPKTLHWFKWEAYSRGSAGFALLAVVYYLHPTTYLVDDARARALAVARGAPSASARSSSAVTSITCSASRRSARSPSCSRSSASRSSRRVAYGLTQTFRRRAAYIHVGALLGTIMAANVFFVIIPNQRVMVERWCAARRPTHRRASTPRSARRTTTTSRSPCCSSW